MIAFRNLYPNEIQVRPTDTKTKGSCTLLLYKDARCDMDILDETVGVENWQKEYYEVKGNVYCRLGIKTEGGWIWKSDCGMESNVDAAKGEASDAFKRACVNFGLGRELYSGPRIKIKCPDNYYFNDKMTMTFYVKSIRYEGKQIISITIVDRFENIVFDWDCNNGVKANSKPVAEPKQQGQDNPQVEEYLAILRTFCKDRINAEPYWKNDIIRFGEIYSKKIRNGWNGPFKVNDLYDSWVSKRKVF